MFNLVVGPVRASLGFGVGRWGWSIASTGNEQNRLKIEWFDVGHFEEFGFREGVGAVGGLVLGDDHFFGFDEVVDALPSIPVGGTRVAVLNGEKGIFLDGFASAFLFSEGVEDLPLPSEGERVPIGTETLFYIFKRWGGG